MAEWVAVVNGLQTLLVAAEEQAEYTELGPEHWASVRTEERRAERALVSQGRSAFALLLLLLA